VPPQTSRNHHLNRLAGKNILFLSFVIKSVVLWLYGDLQKKVAFHPEEQHTLPLVDSS